MSEMELLSIRKALPSDYHDVMDINTNVYDGKDYLPDLFYAYLSNPRKHCFVLLRNGEIIGFTIMYIIDNGETIIGQSGRIKKSSGGRNYMTVLDTKGTEIMKTLYPSLKTNISTITSERIAALNKSIIIFKKVKAATNMTSQRLKSLIHSVLFCDMRDSMDASIPVRVFSAKQAIPILNTINISNFTKDGRWLVCYDPYKPMPSNHEIMLTDNYGSLVIGFAADNKTIQSLTFGSEYFCPIGLKYNISFYFNLQSVASIQDIQKHLIAHVLKHLILLNQRELKCDVAFWAYLPDGYDLKQYLNNFFWENFRLKDAETDPTIGIERSLFGAFNTPGQSKL